MRNASHLERTDDLGVLAGAARLLLVQVLESAATNTQ